VPSSIVRPALPLPTVLLDLGAMLCLKTRIAFGLPFEASFDLPPRSPPPPPDPPPCVKSPLIVSWGIPVARNCSRGPELDALPPPVIVRSLHCAFPTSIVTVTPTVVIVTSSPGPGTTPPDHVPGLLQLPVAIASNPEAATLT